MWCVTLQEVAGEVARRRSLFADPTQPKPMAALVRQKDKETDTEKARAKTPGRSKSRAASRRQERAEKAEDLVELNIRWVRLGDASRVEVPLS